MNVTRIEIDRQLQELQQLQAHAQEPFNYGEDISCAFDLDESMKEVSDTLVLAESLIRRLDCPRGELIDDYDYGIDLRTAANRGFTAAFLEEIAGLIKNELLKDDRVDSIVVNVSQASTTKLLISIECIAVFENLNFSLILSAESGELLIEEMSA